MNFVWRVLNSGGFRDGRNGRPPPFGGTHTTDKHRIKRQDK